MGYTHEQYLEEREISVRLIFDVNLLCLPYSTLQHVCNGIGASWFPEKLRDFISKMNPSLVPVADNHDAGYYMGNGSWGCFKKVNDAFKTNGYKVAKWKYKFYDPRRYWVMWQARKFAALCNAFGWPAYIAAIKERETDEKGMQA